MDCATLEQDPAVTMNTLYYGDNLEVLRQHIYPRHAKGPRRDH
jgi:hypothetical protein